MGEMKQESDHNLGCVIAACSYTQADNEILQNADFCCINAKSRAGSRYSVVKSHGEREREGEKKVRARELARVSGHNFTHDSQLFFHLDLIMRANCIKVLLMRDACAVLPKVDPVYSCQWSVLSQRHFMQSTVVIFPHLKTN